jgi:hypothetical protein
VSTAERERMYQTAVRQLAELRAERTEGAVARALAAGAMRPEGAAAGLVCWGCELRRCAVVVKGLPLCGECLAERDGGQR